MVSDLDIYLKEIGRYDLLTADEEVSLSNKIRGGDQEARDKMIRSNLRLVVNIAKKYQDRGLPLMDLIEEGNIGLFKAVEKFDPEHKTRFSTYGTWWIKQAIRRALVNTTKTVRVPAYIVEFVSKLKEADRQLTNQLGREPSTDELSQELEIPPEKVRLIKRVIRNGTRVQGQMDEEGLASITDILADENARRPDEMFFDNEELRKIHELLSSIDEREAKVLRLRYGLGTTDEEPRTLEQIGDLLGLTRERIRQIENEALRKLHRRLSE